MLVKLLNLFKKRERLTPTYEMLFYQGEHGWHDAKWSDR